MPKVSIAGKREDVEGLDVRVVQTNRVSKTHRGGKTASWSVLVVVGDGKGHVGAGLGKALGIPDAIRKGEEAAKKAMIEVPMVENTIPHAVIGELGATKVLLRPATPGTGVVAGGVVRAILECAGVRDVLAKTLGSRNAVNSAWATMKALSSLVSPKEQAAKRGFKLKQIAPWFVKDEEEEKEQTVEVQPPSAEVREEVSAETESETPIREESLETEKMSEMPETIKETEAMPETTEESPVVATTLEEGEDES